MPLILRAIDPNPAPQPFYLFSVLRVRGKTNLAYVQYLNRLAQARLDKASHRPSSGEGHS
jgi:hypothetical protein